MHRDEIFPVVSLLKGNSAKKKVFLELFLEFSKNTKTFGEKIKLIAV